MEYQEARSRLRREIRKEKAGQLDDLMKDLNVDPWGLAYKKVVHKLVPPANLMDRPTLARVLQNLYTAHCAFSTHSESY